MQLKITDFMWWWVGRWWWYDDNQLQANTDLTRQDLRPSGAVLLPGCSVKETEPGRLQISPHHGGSSIWLAATNNMAEFGEWRDMLEIAANKQRSRVRQLREALYTLHNSEELAFPSCKKILRN